MPDLCPTCNGDGVDPDAEIPEEASLRHFPCPTCDGSGEKRASCPTCGGKDERLLIPHPTPNDEIRCSDPWHDPLPATEEEK